MRLVAGRRGATGPAWCVGLGVAVFAGTLYAMALGLPRGLGAVTPLGGAALIAGWLWFAWNARRDLTV